MPEYRRAFSPGGTFFFTLVAYERRPVFSDRANVDLLRDTIRNVRLERAFDVVAAVVLPDHLHLLLTMPPEDNDYSWRLGRIKARFSQVLRRREHGVLNARRENDIWQRRFWEHLIRDENDFNQHVNYIHYNPVKHRMAKCPHAWPHSSFKYWVQRSMYEESWCCCCEATSAIVQPYISEMDYNTEE